jgi:hypothetical protein
MTRYPQDRASVLATTLISVLARRLLAPEVHAEIAETLREEFHDIARQARDETRPSAGCSSPGNVPKGPRNETR